MVGPVNKILKKMCDVHNKRYYPKFKKLCDEYNVDFYNRPSHLLEDSVTQDQFNYDFLNNLSVNEAQKKIIKIIFGVVKIG